MAQRDDPRNPCSCRFKLYARQRKKTRDRCRRKRQAFVYNPEEEIWHEPYMRAVHQEFSDESAPCDSTIELPWKDIALPTAGWKIRPDAIVPTADRDGTEEEAGIGKRRESDGAMTLPWKDLLVAEVPRRGALADSGPCDSTAEIPWSDLLLERSMEIRPAKRARRRCAPDDVEIPWDEILVPRNIVIEPDRKRKRHPSSGRPPSEPVHVDDKCATCGTYPCCAKTRPSIKATVITCV